MQILYRRQWMQYNGYCGETAVQTFGLYHGAWLSLARIRAAAGRELLIHRPDTTSEPKERTFAQALEVFDIEHEFCPAADADAFLRWLRTQVTDQSGPGGRRRLVALGVVLPGHHDPEYDHIATVVGYDLENASFVIQDHLQLQPLRVPAAALLRRNRQQWRKSNPRDDSRRLAVLDGKFYAISMVRFRTAGEVVPRILTVEQRLESSNQAAWSPADKESGSKTAEVRLGLSMPAAACARLRRWQLPPSAATSNASATDPMIYEEEGVWYAIVRGQDTVRWICEGGEGEDALSSPALKKRCIRR